MIVKREDRRGYYAFNKNTEQLIASFRDQKNIIEGVILFY